MACKMKATTACLINERPRNRPQKSERPDVGRWRAASCQTFSTNFRSELPQTGCDTSELEMKTPNSRSAEFSCCC